jgi:hypothetical protein
MTMSYTVQDLTHLLQLQVAPDTLLDQIRTAPAMPIMRAWLADVVPDLTIPQTTYTRYREFEQNGQRDAYQKVYYAKRGRLTRAVVEMILGNLAMRDHVHDLLWAICEETTWVLPAHEEQGPDFWELHPSPRQTPWGAHTALTREPDAIDLFAAETGAALAETVYLLGDQLAPEVCERVRQEVTRHVFNPYLAYSRQHWWHKGPLNWNGVCNGAIGLAFLRLERDPQTLAEALSMALEGFEAYLASGFEPDGGSIEGISYWNYGLMYYVTLAELLRERSHGQLDLLAAPRLKDVARYPLDMALSSGMYINFGDAVEETALTPGLVQRLAERTGLDDIRGLLISPDKFEGGEPTAAKLPIMLRNMVWWDGQLRAFPAAASQDAYLPACAMIKLTGQTRAGQPLALASKAGHTDGHHSHTDIGTFIVHIAGETLICDPGRGLYSREYFREQRYQNIFCNSFSHSVPRIGGQLQHPGPEFGGSKQYRGTIVEHSARDGAKFVVIDMQGAYAIAGLKLARRTLQLSPLIGEISLADQFAFDETPLSIEEAFLTWCPVEIQGATARILGHHTTLALTLLEPAGLVFAAQSLAEECRINHRPDHLTRLAVTLPVGTEHFRLQIIPG